MKDVYISHRVFVAHEQKMQYPRKPNISEAVEYVHMMCPNISVDSWNNRASSLFVLN